MEGNKPVLLISVVVVLVCIGSLLFSSKEPRAPRRSAAVAPQQRKGVKSAAPAGSSAARGRMKQQPPVANLTLDALHSTLKSKNKRGRLAAARALADAGDISSIPYLIDSLMAPERSEVATTAEQSTPYWANEALKRISRFDAGFVWNASEQSRAHAVVRWRAWFARSSAPADEAPQNMLSSF